MAIQKDLTSPLPASCSSSNSQLRYDVFLSFRGEDTRRSFTDHLYSTLYKEGLVVFRDNEELETGKPIATNLLQAIGQSRIALVVFSKNYASSTWCLDELLEIFKCREQTMGLKVLPIFYDIDPSHVRKQKGTFAEAFRAHNERFKDDVEKVQEWRDALTEIANLRGFHLEDRHEVEFIQEIVETIVSGLKPQVSRNLVGIDSRVQELRKLCVGIKKENDVGFIGIWGMGGIGKTTLARCLVDEISHLFDVTSFLDNVREVSAEKGGLVALQEKLFSNLQISIGTNKGDVDYGFGVIKKRLRHKKVLIILDDVDKSKQLEAFVGSHTWFGKGSRVIITTRDKHLLLAHGVDETYEAKQLNHDEAFQLFSLKAFKNGNHDAEKYMELSHNFVKYTMGLPLAIEVLGHFLCGRDITEWESAYTRQQKRGLDNQILTVLKIGYDGLQEEEKQIFLDIACFFKGKDKDHATMMLESFGFVPYISIKVLIEKALITTVQGKLWMHDLLQEMGWYIVRMECLKEPGKRSRLWYWEDALNVLEHNKGTDVVEGIVLKLPQERKVQLNKDAFTMMKSLRFLRISDVLLPQGLNYLSTELGVVEWDEYPSKLLPQNFPSNKLALLKMCCSHITHLWKGFKASDKLKSIELSDSKSLMESPDFTGVPNLERLIFKGCTKLYRVHPSIGTLQRLKLLNMENCKSLESLPCNISLKYLETLVLSGCERLKKFPEIVGSMGRLSKLYLDGTALQELPLSIQRLTGLTLLDLRDCKKLLRISRAIASWTLLKNINVSGCSNLEDIPEEIGGVESLEELDISGTAIRKIPSTIVHLKNLKSLSASGCKGELSTSWILPWFPSPRHGKGLLVPSSLSGLSSLTNLNLSYCNLLDAGIPNDLDSLPSLGKLNLMGNDFTRIPESICLLPKLTDLNVRYCSKLQSLPKLPISIERVVADCSPSLESDSDQYEVWNSWHNIKEQKLKIVKRSGSHTYGVIVSALPFMSWLRRDHEVKSTSELLRTTYGFSVGANTIPQWFKNQSSSSSVTKLENNKRPWMVYALYVSCVVHESFDTNCALKVMHTFECCFDTNGGLLEKRALYHELNVNVPFTGPHGYWICITHGWFLQRLNALNDCTSIGAFTKTNSPHVEVKMSGARILYNQRDFKVFIEAIKSNARRPLTSRNSGSSSTNPSMSRTEEYGGCNIHSNIPLKDRLESLTLQSYESSDIFGGKKYIIQGNLDRPQLASDLGEILEEYSGHNILYTNCFPQIKVPEWFCRDINGSDFMKDWKGFAVCIAYTVHVPQTLSLSNLDMKYTFRTSIGLSQEIIHHITKSTKDELRQLKQHDFIWISYVSRGSFPDKYIWNDSMQVNCHEYSQDLKVHNYEYQLVQDDMEGFMGAIMECSTMSQSKNFSNEKRRSFKLS